MSLKAVSCYDVFMLWRGSHRKETVPTRGLGALLNASRLYGAATLSSVASSEKVVLDIADLALHL